MGYAGTFLVARLYVLVLDVPLPMPSASHTGVAGRYLMLSRGPCTTIQPCNCPATGCCPQVLSINLPAVFLSPSATASLSLLSFCDALPGFPPSTALQAIIGSPDGVTGLPLPDHVTTIDLTPYITPCMTVLLPDAFKLAAVSIPVPLGGDQASLSPGQPLAVWIASESVPLTGVTAILQVRGRSNVFEDIRGSRLT